MSLLCKYKVSFYYQSKTALPLPSAHESTQTSNVLAFTADDAITQVIISAGAPYPDRKIKVVDVAPVLED